MRDLSNCLFLGTLCLNKLFNVICSKQQMEAYVFFHNWKSISIGCIHNFFLHSTYYTLTNVINGIFFVLKFKSWNLCLKYLQYARTLTYQLTKHCTQTRRSPFKPIWPFFLVFYYPSRGELRGEVRIQWCNFCIEYI